MPNPVPTGAVPLKVNVQYEGQKPVYGCQKKDTMLPIQAKSQSRCKVHTPNMGPSVSRIPY